MRRTILGNNKTGCTEVLLPNISDLLVPNKQSSYIAFSDVTARSMKVSCLVGLGGTGRIAVIRLDNNWTETDSLVATLQSLYYLSDNGDCLSGIVVPTPNTGGYSTICWSGFGGGTLGRTACIYNLLPTTTYYFKFYEFNHNSVGIIYRSDNGGLNPRSRATL